MTSLLERYRAGDRERVWAELLQAPPGDETWAIACETMRRARTNVEAITAKLKAANYRFDNPDSAWRPATPQDAKDVWAIVSKAGPMPLSLRAWYEIVGSVDWNGTHPDWSTFDPGTDPLVIAPVEAVLDWCECEWEDTSDPFLVEIAGDRLQKAGFSGGSYSIACGTHCADAPVKGYAGLTHFVPYLRTCFRNGGFAGFEGYAAGDGALVRSLAQGLLEI